MLKTVFGTYGTITWSKVFGGVKGKPRTAVVEFADLEEAKWVVTNLNGNIAQGLTAPIQVSFKTASEKKKGKGKGKGKFGKGKGFSPYDMGWGGKGFDFGGWGKGSGYGKGMKGKW